MSSGDPTFAAVYRHDATVWGRRHPGMDRISLPIRDRAETFRTTTRYDHRPRPR